MALLEFWSERESVGVAMNNEWSRLAVKHNTHTKTRCTGIYGNVIYEQSLSCRLNLRAVSPTIDCAFNPNLFSPLLVSWFLGAMGLSRLLHVGPLVALAIIKCVSFTTLHYFSQWCFIGHDFQSFLMHFVYYLLIAVTSYNFLTSIFIGPGYVPKDWRPPQKDERFLQYCKQCNAFKAPRSHHCSKCQRCVLKMDHHCPWINNCTGFYNQRNFILFLMFAVIGAIYSIYLLAVTLHRAFVGVPVSCFGFESKK